MSTTTTHIENNSPADDAAGNTRGNTANDISNSTNSNTTGYMTNDISSNTTGHMTNNTVDSKLEKQFVNIGRDLFLSGAITSHGGNLSVSDGQTIWITRTQSMLGRLEKGDVVATTWEESSLDKNASSELIVHRALYHAIMSKCKQEGKSFGSWAVVHAHTAHTTLRSMYYNQIEPLDSECKLLLPTPVQVVRPKTSIGSPEAAKMLANLIENGEKIGIIGGHGPFAIGKTLAQALQIISSLEHTCILSDLVDQKAAAGQMLPNWDK